MVEQVKVSYITVRVLCKLALRLMKYIKETAEDNELIIGTLDMLTTDIGNVTKALKKDISGGHSKELNELDKKLDKAYSALHGYLKVCLKHEEEQINMLAGMLLEIIKHIGVNTRKHKISTQSAQISLLINNLSETKPLDAIHKVGALPWFNSLVKADKAFEDYYQSQIDSQEPEEDVNDLMASQKSLKWHLKFLLDCMRIKEELHPGRYSTTIASINKAINDVMDNAKKPARKKRDETDETADQTGTPESSLMDSGPIHSAPTRLNERLPLHPNQ